MVDPKSPALPAVDDSLLREDSRAELIDGVLRFVPPAEEPHATRNFDLPTVLAPFLKPEFRGAVDMLTRTGHTTNFAPDVSVYPRARDPQTGRRQVDQLSFEVVSASTLEDTAYKARKLLERGVRRVFAIDVEVPALLEWDDAAIEWKTWDAGAVLEDPCFVAPVPVQALLDGVLSEELLVRGLEARGSAALEALRARAVEIGTLEALRGALRAVLASRGWLDEVRAARVAHCVDAAQLQRWIVEAAGARGAGETLA